MREVLNLSLLIVDDEPNVLGLIEKLCKTKFLKVYVASNGVMALDVFKNHEINVILTDINMPQMDGIELCKWVKNKNPACFVAAATAHNEQDYVTKMEGAGFDFIIFKPMNGKLLTDFIKKIHQTNTA